MPKKIVDEYIHAEGNSEAIEKAQELPAVESVPLWHQKQDESFEATPLRVGLRNTETEEIVGVVGSRYVPLQHEDMVLQTLQGLETRGIEVGKVSYGLTPQRLHARITFKDIDVSREGAQAGDIVSFGLMLVNSYDGTTPVKAALCGERLVCTNGMTSGVKDLTKMSAKHVATQIADFSQNLNKFLNELDEDLGKWVARIKTAQVGDLTMQEAGRILDADKRIGSRLAARIWERLPEEQQAHFGALNRWTLYNAATHVLTHTVSGDEETPMFNEKVLAEKAAVIDSLLSVDVPSLEDMGEEYAERELLTA